MLADEDVSRLQREINRRLTDDDRRADPIEFTARTADGDAIPCELELHLLVEDGAFQGSMGVVRDITERKQVERDLQQERDLIDGIVETSPIGIAVVDDDGTVTFANEPSCSDKLIPCEGERSEPLISSFCISVAKAV